MRTFDDTWAIASKIEGNLTRDEARELWQRAAMASGDVVEVGCGYGRSSVLFAGNGPIVCAERWNRGACHQDQYFVWRKNIVDSGMAGNIELLQEGDSYHNWESPVGLLYVDVPATAGAQRQMSGWQTHMVRGSVLCIYGNATPPKSFMIEKTVGNITTYRKY
jgi:hypothetical protein